MSNAPLKLIPKVDNNSLKRAMRKTTIAYKKVARKAAKFLEKETGGAMEKGLRYGIKKGMSGAKSAGGMVKGKIGGMAGAAFAAFGAATGLGGGQELADRVDSELAMIENIVLSAQSFRVKEGEYAGMRQAFVASGLSGELLNTTMSKFVDALNKDETMVRYKEMAESTDNLSTYMNFLTKAASMGGAEGEAYIGEVFSGPNAAKVGRLVSQIREMIAAGEEVTLETIYKKTTGSAADFESWTDKLKKNMDNVAAMDKKNAEEFERILDRDYTEHTKQALRLKDAQMEEYEAQLKGMKTKIDAQIVLIAAQKKGQEMFNELLDNIRGLVEKIGEFFGDGDDDKSSGKPEIGGKDMQEKTKELVNSENANAQRVNALLIKNR